MFRAALDLQGNRDAKMRNSMQIVAGTVERVDDPDALTLALRTTFLSEYCMVREPF